MRNPRFIVLLLISVFWTPESAVSQSQVAVLEGTVRELDGAPLAGVEIQARRTETNELYVRETDASGVYGWGGLPVGDYAVLASKNRFDSQRRQSVRLQVGQRVRLDFRLRRTSPGKSSKISEDLSQLTVERDDVGQLIDSKQLRNMPSKERNFRDLVSLAPGAVSQGTRRIQVLGMSWRDNLTYFDGTLITGGNGSSSLTPSSEAIREFDVKTSLYSAQYGIRSGGQVLLVTRHGGNRFHGGLFWFHRNDNLDAGNYSEQRK
ncbi:MAG: carboxypeptidase regulatory-like domain-containing protein, partial [Candidatus Aminicenantes bacterium]|nr:carboxypeptidase regulatory-like domain-containing protein [Candidatus Aminicenantes bacterium]